MMQKMYETDRIILSPFSVDELTGKYRSWFHDPDVTRYNSHGLFPYTKSQMESFLKTIKDGSDSNIVFAIYAKGVAKINVGKIFHIGNISLDRINYINRSCELALVVGDKDYWNKGYGKEACELALKHAFHKLNMHRVWTGTAELNIGMIRLANRLGMKEEGTFRDAAYLYGGYCDIQMFSILRHEYDGRT